MPQETLVVLLFEEDVCSELTLLRIAHLIRPVLVMRAVYRSSTESAVRMLANILLDYGLIMLGSGDVSIKLQIAKCSLRAITGKDPVRSTS